MIKAVEEMEKKGIVLCKRKTPHTGQYEAFLVVAVKWGIIIE
jgi:hypothetical protein